MNTLALILAPLFALQSAGETAIAIRNDAPETWTLEYPRIIQPYIADYRRCLTGRMRRVTGEANFEAQHRSDVPACEDERETALDRANVALEGRPTSSGFTGEDVRALFVRMDRIHVARGADLDRQFRQRIEAAAKARARYEEEKPRGLVLELRDASVVKARTNGTAPTSGSVN